MGKDLVISFGSDFNPGPQVYGMMPESAEPQHPLNVIVKLCTCSLVSLDYFEKVSPLPSVTAVPPLCSVTIGKKNMSPMCGMWSGQCNLNVL